MAQALGQGRTAERESAIARLTLVGARALPALLEVLKQGSSTGRVDALAVIEQQDAPLARAAVLGMLGGGDPVVARRALEACAHFPDAGTVEALRGHARSGPAALRLVAVESLLALLEQGVVEAMDPLLERVLETAEDEGVRRAALGALRTLSKRERTPILARLRERPRDPVGHRLLEGFHDGAPGGPPAPADTAAGRRGVPSTRSPAKAGAAGDDVDRLVEDGGPAAIAALHHLLERLPRADEKAARTRDLASLRGRIHGALATLGSRIALYDLRECLTVRPALAPAPLLSAATVAGDASLVPALAALAVEESTHHDACVAALTAIVRRERLRRTSASVKAVKAAHRAILDRVWPPPRATKAGPSGQRGTTSRRTR